MITVRNEFEPVPAYEIVAGHPDDSLRQIAYDLIHTIGTVTQEDTAALFKELAGDLDDGELQTIIDNAVVLLNGEMPMPVYCSIEYEEDSNWYRVIPDEEGLTDAIADGTFKVIHDPNEIDQCAGEHDYLMHTNDHGNVTLYSWSATKGEYVIEWEMV